MNRTPILKLNLSPDLFGCDSFVLYPTGCLGHGQQRIAPRAKCADIKQSSEGLFPI